MDVYVGQRLTFGEVFKMGGKVLRMRGRMKLQSLGVHSSKALPGLCVTSGKYQLGEVSWPYGTLDIE